MFNNIHHFFLKKSLEFKIWCFLEHGNLNKKCTEIPKFSKFQTLESTFSLYKE